MAPKAALARCAPFRYGDVMLTLYHAPRSRSSRFIWLLEELGVPYELSRVDIRRGDGSGREDFVNPHPHGKVPVIDHDGEVVYESVAIALYLTDAFPAAGLGPKVGDKTRGPYLSWLAYYAGVVESSFMSAMQKSAVPRGTAGWVVTDEVMAHINTTLARQDYLLGDKFSAADVIYSSTFALFSRSPLLTMTEELKGYIERCTSRPAFAKAAAKDDA